MAGVVVELHQAEDQICRHQLEAIRRIRDHVSVSRGTNIHKTSLKSQVFHFQIHAPPCVLCYDRTILEKVQKKIGILRKSSLKLSK